MARNDGRSENQLRTIKFTRHWHENAEGSVLVEFGNTRVLCVASFTLSDPRAPISTLSPARMKRAWRSGNCRRSTY